MEERGRLIGRYLQISADLQANLPRSTSLSSISSDLNLDALAPNHPFRTAAARAKQKQKANFAAALCDINTSEALFLTPKRFVSVIGSNGKKALLLYQKTKD